MAEITNFTRVGGRIPRGQYFEQTYRVVVANAGAADEWFKTDFSSIIAVTGHAVYGTATSGVNFVRNCGTGTTGTSGAVDSTHGSLAIEAVAAATIDVTVVGTP